MLLSPVVFSLFVSKKEEGSSPFLITRWNEQDSSSLFKYYLKVYVIFIAVVQDPDKNDPDALLLLKLLRPLNNLKEHNSEANVRFRRLGSIVSSFQSLSIRIYCCFNTGNPPLHIQVVAESRPKRSKSRYPLLKPDLSNCCGQLGIQTNNNRRNPMSVHLALPISIRPCGIQVKRKNDCFFRGVTDVDQALFGE